MSILMFLISTIISHAQYTESNGEAHLVGATNLKPVLARFLKENKSVTFLHDPSSADPYTPFKPKPVGKDPQGYSWSSRPIVFTESGIQYACHAGIGISEKDKENVKVEIYNCVNANDGKGGGGRIVDESRRVTNIDLKPVLIPIAYVNSVSSETLGINNNEREILQKARERTKLKPEQGAP